MEKRTGTVFCSNAGEKPKIIPISKKRPEGGIGKPSSADQRVSLHPALGQLHHLPHRQLYVDILTSTVFIFYFVLTWPSMEDDSKRRIKNISGKNHSFNKVFIIAGCLGVWAQYTFPIMNCATLSKYWKER